MGTAFNVEEKEFLQLLYDILFEVFGKHEISDSDFLAFLKCLHIVFVQKR